MNVSEELVERMSAFIRWFADSNGGGQLEGSYSQYKEAQVIVAELPKPIDPDLLAAREIVSKLYPLSAEYYLSGRCDDVPTMIGLLAGIKHGRKAGGGEG